MSREFHNRPLYEERLKRLSVFTDMIKETMYSFFEKYPNEAIENDEMQNCILTALKELCLENKLVELDDEVNGYSLFTHPKNSIWGK